MTDNEIIKALECCSTVTAYCGVCPLCKIRVECDVVLPKNALDLINRQKAEIERLKEELADARYLNTVAESDAIKEFAERLKATVTINNTNDGYLDYAVDYSCLMEDIDNLVKEMTVGKDNA